MFAENVLILNLSNDAQLSIFIRLYILTRNDIIKNEKYLHLISTKPIGMDFVFLR